MDYVPRSYQQAAEEKRHQGRVKRIEGKRRGHRCRDQCAFLLEQSAIEPMPIIDLAPRSCRPARCLWSTMISPFPRRRPRRLARPSFPSRTWRAMRSPIPPISPVTRFAFSGTCLQRQTEIELLRLEGIDVDALYDVVRSVA